MIFSDYMRPTIRLAAMMGIRPIYVFTHDSIFLGEDGPTHQPIEQLASLRAIPNLSLIRPADANETTVAWRVAIEMRCQIFFGDRHPDAVSESLAERTRGGLNSLGQPVFGMARCLASPLPELLQFIQRHVVAGQMEQAVKQHAAMAR